MGGLYLWKLLSRDFSNIALFPESVISGYPIDIYSPDWILPMAIPPFFDLTNFHFIHYFLPTPDELIFTILQNLTIFLAIVFMFANGKVSKFVGIIFYILISYLWGFVFRLGQEIDAVFLLQGTLFVYCILPYEKNNQYYRKLRFLTLIVFVIYYFSSGLNKFIDLSYSEWLRYELTNINSSKVLAHLNENYLYVPEFPIQNENFKMILSKFGAPLSYIVHMLSPLLLLTSDIKKISVYWFFYTLFHFMTIYVGILFMMNFFAWLLIIPIYSLTKKND